MQRKEHQHQKLLLPRKQSQPQLLKEGKFFQVPSDLSFSYFRARVVPENILKKQARDAKLLKALKDSRDKAKSDRAAARKVAAANAEKYFNEYQKADSDLIAAKRDAKAKGSFFVEGEAKVAFIIRIRG